MKTFESPKTFEDFGVALGTAPQPYDTGDSVELAVATYQNLGLIADEGKAREAFGQEIASLQAALPESVTTQPHDIVMVTRLGELSFANLIDRYNQLTTSKGNPPTEPWEPLWGKYTDEELNQGQTAAMEARAVLLGGENEYNEPGLYYTRQTLKEQRKSLKEAQSEHDGKATTLNSVSPASYMVRNAMQLERGEQLMDRPTFTRFIELDSKRVGVISYVPLADSVSDGRVCLLESHELAYPRGGVRLSVGQESVPLDQMIKKFPHTRVV